MKPAIGRIVHYTQNENDIHAAIIANVNNNACPPRVTLFVLYSGGWTFWATSVPQAENGVPAGDYRAIGKWQWPAREG